MADSTAHAHWQGSLLEGSGSVAAGSGVFGHLPVSWATRTERVEGTTSPEELIAAGTRRGVLARTERRSLEVGAVCTFHPKSGGGFEIRSIALSVEGVVPGIDQAEFARLAVEGDKGCPVSNALRGNVEITVTATLN